ncbi:hypothetical protein PAXINDRAFT_158325, partial [Paxillus involutus ATCC 200175]
RFAAMIRAGVRSPLLVAGIVMAMSMLYDTMAGKRFPVTKKRCLGGGGEEERCQRSAYAENFHVYLFLLGCQDPFSLAGYSRHLSLTTHGPCIVIHERLQATCPAGREDEEAMGSPLRQFEGDFFGDYEEGDLEWPGSPGGHLNTEADAPQYSGDPSAGADEIDLEQVLDEDEDEQAANNVELEGGWEPEAEPGNTAWGLSEADCHQVSLWACWTAYP